MASVRSVSSPVSELEPVFPSTEDSFSASPPVRATRRARRVSGRAVATLTALAIVGTLGGSGAPLASANAHQLQSRAAALQARWGQMVADGVPRSDLAGLEAEVKSATALQVF